MKRATSCSILLLLGASLWAGTAAKVHTSEAGIATAQEDFPDTTPKRRLRTPARVTGFIGGESHDSYVVRVRKGPVMTVQISWRREGSNRTEFHISESPNGYTGEPVSFGRDFNNGRRWRGKIPKDGDYHIYVVAHPTAHYTLKINVN